MSADRSDAGRRRRCGVLGSPIGHSLSPLLHRAAYVALDISWEYDAHEVTVEQLDGFVKGLDNSWQGLSLTRPLKRAAVAQCSRMDPLADRLQAVNTMVRAADSSWSGHNTDVGGCVDALEAVGVTGLSSGLIVGAGATAGSALAAMHQLGAERVEVMARSVERAARLVALGDRLGVRVSVSALADLDATPLVDLVVSTIPAEAQAECADALAGSAPVVFDVVYEPRLTPLLAAAGREGAITVPGLELLLHQAARQVVLMTGAAVAPLEAMRAAIR
jgi:shikimate dehydrogenase